MSTPTPDYPLDEFDRITSTIPMVSPFRTFWNEAEEFLQKAYPDGFEPEEIGRVAFDCLPEAERDAAMDELFYAFWERIVEARERRAERDEARAELEKYVGKEPTVAEEMEYLSRLLNAVHDLCDAAEKQARRWEQPLPVPEWVEQVRAAASGERPEDPSDNRRRIYIDGKADGWIDLTVDPETGEHELTGITNPWKIASAEEVRNDTGGLREIGRCW